ncbi:MAG: pilus assembly protein TadG-related protein [Pseudorhodoplanes sp.]
MSILQKLRNGLHAFCGARGGNVTVTFALATLPMVAFVGAAVDYSRSNSARAAMQAALDAAALSLSKEANGLNTAQLNSKALSYFLANFNRPDAKNVMVTPTYTDLGNGKFKMAMTAKATMPTTFMSMWQSSVDIGTEAQVIWGYKKLELALALDNTGSMSSSSKMTNLKTAAKNLIDTLKKAAKKDGDVKIAIIPFDKVVNLGTAYKNNDWFDWDEIDCNGNQNGNGCNANTWKNYWDGCVADRTYPHDAQDTSPNPNTPATLFPAADCGSLVTLMPLTYNWTALTNKIDSMQPNGNTNVTIGLAWAWHALTPNAPLSEALDPNPDLDKVIILLTDGDNTESWKNSNNSKVKSTSSIDTRTQLICTNVKAANIKLYTIRVIDGNANLLRNCATNTSMYFDVQQASQLDSVFKTIANSLAQLRLSE